MRGFCDTEPKHWNKDLSSKTYLSSVTSPNPLFFKPRSGTEVSPLLTLPRQTYGRKSARFSRLR